jgi:alpha-beta hydrolase superfamily lysophospholipase
MRRMLRRTVRILLAVFILMNMIAALHAWRFTHFEEGAVKTKDKGLSFWQKAKLAVTGVSMPRPLNRNAPDTVFERVQVQSNVALEAWWIPVAAPRGSILICHGFGGSKGGMLDKARVFRAMGYNTLLLDFMGAGGSPGNQCTIGWKESVEVRDAARWMQRRSPGLRRILFGTSMGAAAIMKAVADSKDIADALIIECPFGTMMQTVKNRFHTQGVPAFPMAQLLLFWGGTENGFNAFANNPETFAKSIRVPTVLLWGEKDEKVMRFETETIFRNLAGPKELRTFAEAGHENYLRQYREEWAADVQGFLNAY